VVSGGASTTNLIEGTNLYYTDARVRVNRLDQMAAPIPDVSLNSQRITIVATSSAAGDAATEGFVDGLSQGLDIKTSVRAASTTARALASSVENGDAIDGVTGPTPERRTTAKVNSPISWQYNGRYGRRDER
jgi:hypothetical protein